MEIPRYLQVLWKSKWLLLVGIVVAAASAFFAGYTVTDGEIESRAEQTYTAGTTVMVSSQTQPLYQAVIPGQPLVEGESAPTDVDLTSKAIIYAYLVSGVDMRTAVQAQVGEFDDTENITALRRTTQPGGNEAFAGRYVLPIIEIVGTSNNPERAVEISRAAAGLFNQRVVDDQNASGIPESDRVVLTTLDEKPAVAVEGSNPAIPLVVTFLGVFLLFVATAYIIAGAAASRERKRALREADEAADDDAADAEGTAIFDDGETDELAPTGQDKPAPARRRQRASARNAADDPREPARVV